MKLHYSQTILTVKKHERIVLLPYEITLFSNENITNVVYDSVLLPYEITLFSNIRIINIRQIQYFTTL